MKVIGTAILMMALVAAPVLAAGEAGTPDAGKPKATTSSKKAAHRTHRRARHHSAPAAAKKDKAAAPETK